MGFASKPPAPVQTPPMPTLVEQGDDDRVINERSKARQKHLTSVNQRTSVMGGAMTPSGGKTYLGQ